MKTRTMWMAVATVAVLVLIVGGAGAVPPRSIPEATVTDTINYQGRLTDPSGTPLDGTYPMRFQVHDDPVVNSVLWDSGIVSVEVDHGLFNVALDVDPTDFDGQGLWLRIYVDSEWLTPRQELMPVPYALSLRPGAEIEGEPTAWDGWVLRVNMDGSYPVGKAIWGSTATGTAVRGESTGGYGVYGYSEDGYAVSGVNSGTNQARGYGGHFSSQNGVGVYGYSSAQSHYANRYAPGVYGRSANGAGVYGLTDSSSWTGYGGYFEGRIGVGARSTGEEAGNGYAASFVSENYRGIYGTSLASYYAAYFESAAGIYSSGGYSTLHASQLVVVNGGDEALEPGDVVAIAGIVESPDGGEPLLSVHKADEFNSKALVGVVVQAMRVEMKEIEGEEGLTSLDVQPVEGTVSPGGYLAIVTSGLAPAVKVDVPTASLEIGDLITASAVPGVAWKVAAGLEGHEAILGKVAGPVDAETGTVPVFITLR